MWDLPTKVSGTVNDDDDATGGGGGGGGGVMHANSASTNEIERRAKR
jgi:hypothetical protein